MEAKRKRGDSFNRTQAATNSVAPFFLFRLSREKQPYPFPIAEQLLPEGVLDSESRQ